MTVIEIVSGKKKRHIETSEKSFDIHYQEADFHSGSGRPRPIEVRPPRKGEYAPGLYTIDPSSFTTNRYDQLELSYLALMPLDRAITELNTFKSSRPETKARLSQKK